MRTTMLAAATAMTLLACVDTASAAGGCGPGFHRGPYGDAVLMQSLLNQRLPLWWRPPRLWSLRRS